MPIGCSILPYYHLGSISFMIFPNPETNEFDSVDLHISRGQENGKQKTFYQKIWEICELKNAVKSSQLQDVFPELLEAVAAIELDSLNKDKATLLELLEDPWHKKAHQQDSH